MTTPPFVSPGSPVLASQLDGLLKAADDRLAALYSGGRSPLVFNAVQPAHQTFPLGAVYVMSADAKRFYIPGPPDGNWPPQYSQAELDAELASLTVIGPTEDRLSVVVNGWNHAYYNAGDSLAILRRTWVDPETGTPHLLPIRLEGAWQPDRFWRYGLADILFEDEELTGFTWQPAWRKYGCVRFHNLTSQLITIGLDDGQELAIPKYECRVIRRFRPEDPWSLTGRRYFPPAMHLDVPSWYWLPAQPTQMASRADASQVANPLVNLCLIAQIFQPTQVALGPGMYHGAPTHGLVAPAEAKLADVLGHGGDFSIIRLRTGDEVAERHDFSITLASHLVGHAGLAAIGLDARAEDSTRGLILEHDGTTQPEDPPGGTYHYDAIGYTTNALGGVCRPIRNPARGIQELVSRLYFPSVETADAWYRELFRWPTVALVVTQIRNLIIPLGEWVPDVFDPEEHPAAQPPYPNNAFPNVIGEWRELGYEEHFGQAAYWEVGTSATVAPWNLFIKTTQGALGEIETYDPNGALSRSDVRLSSGPVRSTVSLTETGLFWQEAIGPDQACPIFGVGQIQASEWVESPTGGLGLGTLTGLGYQEPRWQESILPTRAGTRLSQVLSCGRGEPWAYTTITFVGEGPSWGRIHPRVIQAEGGADGAPWRYDSTLALGASEFGFARLWWWHDPPPPAGTGSGGYDPETIAGPPVLRVRDHGKMIPYVLGEQFHRWAELRAKLYDDTKGSYIDTEDELTHQIQVRMHATHFNATADLVRRVRLIRPLGFEQWKKGFAFDSLHNEGGWSVSTGTPKNPNPAAPPDGSLRWMGGGALGVTVQPAGCVHTASGYEYDYMDTKLEALGIPFRTAPVPTQLQALETIPLRCFFLVDPPAPPSKAGLNLYSLPEANRPDSWKGLQPLRYVHFDDLREYLDSSGWAWSYFAVVNPVRLVSYVPSLANEEMAIQHSTPWTKDSPTLAWWGQIPVGLDPGFRLRPGATFIGCVQDQGGDLQIRNPGYYARPLVEEMAPLTSAGYGAYQEQEDREEWHEEGYWITRTYTRAHWAISWLRLPAEVMQAISNHGRYHQGGAHKETIFGGGYWQTGAGFRCYKIITNQTVRLLAVPYPAPYTQAGPLDSFPDLLGQTGHNLTALRPPNTIRPINLTVSHGSLVRWEDFGQVPGVEWYLRRYPDHGIVLPV